MQELPVAKIYRGERARPLIDANVEALCASILAVGLINPILVRPVNRMHGGVPRDVYEIIAGCHRYQAVCSLGWETVACKVIEGMDDLHVELSEIDENLIRTNLTKAQEAIAVSRRKEIYEALHPETVHGHAGAKARWDAVATVATASAERFTTATAKATGKSERAIQLAAEAGKKLGADLHGLVGTSLDSVRELQALTQMTPEERAPVIERAKAGEKVRATELRRRKEPKVAADPLADVEANERQVARLMDAWNAAGPDARQEFLSRIDQPIMDQRYG
jgi:ParB family chromosome partitioning protein